MPENTVCVDRSTRWGNPFQIANGTTREEAVFAHKALLHGYLCITQRTTHDEQVAYAKYVKRNIARLRGKNLACWCPLVDKDGNKVPCHADVLLELSNA
jgi:hypothetical protein